jgi:hypothetical protein
MSGQSRKDSERAWGTNQLLWAEDVVSRKTERKGMGKTITYRLSSAERRTVTTQKEKGQAKGAYILSSRAMHESGQREQG